MNSQRKPFSCYIVSLKYAPGLWKEFTLIGNHLQSEGFCVSYLLSKSYRQMGILKQATYLTSSEDITQTIRDSIFLRKSIIRCVSTLFKKHPPAMVLLYNSHPLNESIFRLAKQLCPHGIRAVFLHEPGKYEKTKYGLFWTTIFFLLERIQARIIDRCTDVILPSPFAKELFSLRYPRYHRRSCVVSLLVSDNDLHKLPISRQYISMVGRFNATKRLDDFIQVINLAATRNAGLRFQIVTASKIDNAIMKLSDSARKITTIINPNHLSDSQILHAIKSSIAVMCLHTGVTQSGVIPICFQQATPVIALDSRGFSQYICHGQNGWLIPKIHNTEQLYQAICDVKQNATVLSDKARNTYDAVFSEKKWNHYYQPLLETLKSFLRTDPQ